MKAKSTWKPVMAIQGRDDADEDSGAPVESMVARARRRERRGCAVKSSAMAVTAARGRRRPRVPLSRKPAKGSSGMSQR